LFAAAALVLAIAAPEARAAGGAKATQTPAFCQTDPTAGFKGSGENYCAPTALSDGIMFLAASRHYNKLVAGRGHDAHAKLIKALAKQMGTDPANGTGPGGIIRGYAGYVVGQKYQVGRLEYQGWRDTGAAQAKYGRGKQPQLAWLTAAANDQDAVLLLNVGWYKPVKGGFKRSGGHWIEAVGTGAGKSTFLLRNPSKQPGDQASNNTITLAPLDAKFKTVASPGAPTNLAGYYKASGPGLPSGSSTAVLDCALVFGVKK
jgi:hypothetical protein